MFYMKSNASFESIICSASQLLIEKVFSLHCSSMKGNECATILQQQNRKNIKWYLCTVEFDNIHLQLYAGFTPESFIVFMENAYYGLKQLENEIDHELLYTNVIGMIIFKFHNDVRHKVKKMKYFLNESISSVPYNDIDTLFLGKKSSNTVLYLGCHTI